MPAGGYNPGKTQPNARGKTMQRNLTLYVDTNGKCVACDADDVTVATFESAADAYLFLDATKSLHLAYSRKRQAERAAQYALDMKNRGQS
jgi:hypothetical protein